MVTRAHGRGGVGGRGAAETVSILTPGMVPGPRCPLPHPREWLQDPQSPRGQPVPCQQVPHALPHRAGKPVDVALGASLSHGPAVHRE